MNKTAVLGTVEVLIERCGIAVLLIELRVNDRAVVLNFLGDLMRMTNNLLEYISVCQCREPIPELIRDIHINIAKVDMASKQHDYGEILFRLLDNIRPALQEIRQLVEEKE